MHAQQPDSALVKDSMDVEVFYEALSDSLMLADSLASDTLLASQAEGGDIEAEVKYSASDSLIFALDGGAVELYGDAHIEYEDITLDAAYIRYEMDLNLVIANGLPDSTGTIAVTPILKR